MSQDKVIHESNGMEIIEKGTNVYVEVPEDYVAMPLGAAANAMAVEPKVLKEWIEAHKSEE